jgi:hypothetical protein
MGSTSSTRLQELSELIVGQAGIPDDIFPS